MPRSTEYLNKLAYPPRDHKLALKILRVLNQDKYLSTQTIADELGTNFPYGHKKVKITLERLNAYGYCEGTQTKEKTSWQISFKGKLLLLVFGNQNFRKFIEKNQSNKIMKLASVLLKSHKNENVHVLIDNLRYAYNTGHDLEKTSTDWYRNTKKIISQMIIDGKKYPDLVKLQSEIKDENMTNTIMRARAGLSNLDLGENNWQ